MFELWKKEYKQNLFHLYTLKLVIVLSSVPSKVCNNNIENSYKYYFPLHSKLFQINTWIFKRWLYTLNHFDLVLVLMSTNLKHCTYIKGRLFTRLKSCYMRLCVNISVYLFWYSSLFLFILIDFKITIRKRMSCSMKVFLNCFITSWENNFAKQMWLWIQVSIISDRHVKKKGNVIK